MEPSRTPELEESHAQFLGLADELLGPFRNKLVVCCVEHQHRPRGKDPEFGVIQHEAPDLSLEQGFDWIRSGGLKPAGLRELWI